MFRNWKISAGASIYMDENGMIYLYRQTIGRPAPTWVAAFFFMVRFHSPVGTSAHNLNKWDYDEWLRNKSEGDVTFLLFSVHRRRCSCDRCWCCWCVHNQREELQLSTQPPHAAFLQGCGTAKPVTLHSHQRRQRLMRGWLQLEKYIAASTVWKCVVFVFRWGWLKIY